MIQASSAHRRTWFALAVIASAALAPCAAWAAMTETPVLAEAVNAGTLPPVDQRVPEEPLMVPLEGEGLATGQPGGSIDMLFGRAKDIRMLVVYGYTRLVGYDRSFNIVPDIVSTYGVKEGREFTFKLRKGHKWSDGVPFTSEDFRYFWEDMVLDPVISEDGPPDELLVNGKLPKFEVIDAETVRYTWEEPNPNFLIQLAGAQPLYLYRPAHFLKKFHAKYTDEEKLEELVEKAEARNWRALHFKMDRQYANDLPQMPTLDPWVNTTESPSERYVFKRNPFFHRIDAAGNQLPYADQVVANITNGDLIPAKVGAGESMLQARNLELKNFPVLKSAEERNGYAVNLWRSGRGSQLALFPNLNVKDPVWRQAVRDARFRRALSLGIDRNEVNEVVFFGLGVAANNTVLADSPLFKPEYQTLWADYNIEQANALLDEMGLTERNGEGFRKLPDGRIAEIVVETAGEDTNETDVLVLIRDSWKKIGIKLLTNVSTREVLRSRATSGDLLMSTWTGYENAVPTADYPPFELAPTRDDQQNWPLWGLHTMTNGKGGEAIDDPTVQSLIDDYQAWLRTSDQAERTAIWHHMLKTHADNVYSIGIVSAVPQPVVVSNKLRNVPKEGLYNWDPGAFFGIYRPDTFWIEK
ncbi:MAG: ABC transporter substrate-binding protein [Hyphomicrobiaceae bacterium]